MSFTLLHKHTHYGWCTLDEVCHWLLGTHLQLAAKLPDADWTLTDHITFKKSSCISLDKTWQCSKFQ